uniref:Uncharacterized protein n=1 Tax=Opuntia streptacantha TaxID=393608 RepID=A0A7C8YVT4_OPUST
MLLICSSIKRFDQRFSNPKAIDGSSVLLICYQPSLCLCPCCPFPKSVLPSVYATTLLRIQFRVCFGAEVHARSFRVCNRVWSWVWVHDRIKVCIWIRRWIRGRRIRGPEIGKRVNLYIACYYFLRQLEHRIRTRYASK